MDAPDPKTGRVVVVDVPSIPSDEVAVPSALAEHLRIVVRQGYELVVLNVEALTHPDSMTLAAIVQTYVRAVKGGGTVKLTNVSKRFRDLLTVTKLDKVIEIVNMDAYRNTMTIEATSFDPSEMETKKAKAIKP